MRVKTGSAQARHISYRFCTICKKGTKFKYDSKIQHSRCTRCKASSKFSLMKRPKKVPGVRRRTANRARPIDEAKDIAKKKMEGLYGKEENSKDEEIE